MVTGRHRAELPTALKHEAPEGGQHRLSRIPGGDRFDQPRAEGLEPGEAEVLPGREGVEDGRLGDLRLAGDVGDRHPVEPAVGEQPPRGAGDQLARLLLLAPAEPVVAPGGRWHKV